MSHKSPNSLSTAPGCPDFRTSIYDAGNRDRIALSAWASMFRELWAYRELIHRLIARNISGQFRQSFLGYLWIALPPIATTIVFTLLRKSDVVNVPMPADGMPYALFVLVGTTIWQYFAQTTSMATVSIAGAGALVSKIYFPREVLILAAVGNAVVNLLVRLAVTAVVFLLMAYAPHWQVVFLPLVLVPVLFLGLGLGLFFAPLNTMMNDIGRLLEFAFQFGMFLAPTVYPTPDLATAGTQWQRILYWLHTLNPVTHFIHAADNLIQYGTFNFDTGFLVATAVCFLTWLLGWRFFHICEPLLAERL